MPALSTDKWSDVHANTSDVMLVSIQNRCKNWLLGLITDYHMCCRWKFIMIKCALYKKCDAPYPSWGCGTAVAAVKRPTLIHLCVMSWPTARVKLDMTVCAVGGSWYSSLFEYCARIGKCSESVQSRAEVYVLKACDACTDIGQL